MCIYVLYSVQMLLKPVGSSFGFLALFAIALLCWQYRLFYQNKILTFIYFDIANFMGFAKASVSVALKKLKSYNYVNVDESTGYIELTKEGEQIAKATYERHQVISRALIALGVSEKTALEDACAVEHIISEETFHVLKEKFK